MANPNPSPATRFKKGWKGGPGGHPRGRRITDALAELIEKDDAYQAIAAKWLKAILDGDFRYLKEAVDRFEGKVPDRVIGMKDDDDYGPIDISAEEDSPAQDRPVDGEAT